MDQYRRPFTRRAPAPYFLGNLNLILSLNKGTIAQLWDSSLQVVSHHCLLQPSSFFGCWPARHLCKSHGLKIKDWVLPPLSNSWIIRIVWLYIALNKTPHINCYWVGAVPKLRVWGL